MTITDVGAFSYDLDIAPPGYRCGRCGVHGVKLWRESHASHIDIRCVGCAARCSANITGLNDSDQIRGRVPAIPDEDGTSWWGYAAVPHAGAEWWHRLPSSFAVLPGRKSMTAAEARTADAAYAAEKAKQTAADNATIDAMLASTAIAVEATDYESMLLWEQWCEPRDSRPIPSWDHVSLGIRAHIGEFGGEPVCVSTSFARINGSIVAFWECTSSVSHRPTIDAWIASKMPRASRTDAMNFAPPAADRDPATGNIEQGPHVTRRQATAGQLAVRSIERSPMNARRWFVLLACGHGIWMTASRRPTLKTAGCAKCATL